MIDGIEGDDKLLLQAQVGLLEWPNEELSKSFPRKERNNKTGPFNGSGI